MRNKKVTSALVSILTAILMVFVISTTVFATDEVAEVTEQPPQVVETEENVVEEETQPPQQEVTEPEQQEPQTQPQTEEETEEQTEKVTQTDNDANDDKLPQVESQEVTAPTTVELPDVEVSDTSLLFGVIAWLCVAVGIAVIAGVLVSQRARQSGTNSNSRDTRRK